MDLSKLNLIELYVLYTKVGGQILLKVWWVIALILLVFIINITLTNLRCKKIRINSKRDEHDK